MKFDFDEWAQLFQSNPEEAERRRTEMIEGVIAEAPPVWQENLRRLQERIDMVRTCYKDSPMVTCRVLNQMLMDRVHGAGGLVARLEELSELVKQYVGVDGTDGHSA